MKFNFKDDIGDGSASVVVEFGHHQMTTALHVMRLNGHRISGEHPIPTAHGERDEHEQDRPRHGHTGGCDLSLERGQNLGRFLRSLPVFKLLSLERRSTLSQVLGRWFHHVDHPKIMAKPLANAELMGSMTMM